jgi:hypothetical protein
MAAPVTVLLREHKLLANSGMFDSDYYIQLHPDIAALNIDPLMHNIERGFHERRDLSERFDTSHYLRQCEYCSRQLACLKELAVADVYGIRKMLVEDTSQRTQLRETKTSAVWAT